MRPFQLLHRVAAAGCMAAVALVAPSTTFAADAVYGGTTSDGEAVVMKADARSQSLRSITLSWRARCDDDSSFINYGTLTATGGEPGFTPSPDELLVSRNAKGRFKGVQLAGRDLDASAAAISVTVAGKLTPRSATGTVEAEIAIIDKATGVTVMNCRAKQRWKASHAPAVVYGGTTSQDQPIVLRLNAARKKVSDMYVIWSADCGNGTGWRFPDNLVNFPLKRSGAFGEPFNFTVPLSAGGTRRFDYVLAGKVGKASAKGRLQVKITETDAAGTALPTCDTGPMTWKTSSS